MTGRELNQMLHRTGHERKIRKMAIEMNLAKPEDIAVMTSEDVCELIIKADFVVLDPGEEGFFLVHTDSMNEVKNKLWCISR